MAELVTCYLLNNDATTELLTCRRQTITALGQIFIELQSFGKDVNKSSRISKAVSVVAGTASVVMFVISPATGGTSTAGGVALLGLSGAAAATSLGTKVYQHIVEKGLVKKAKEALDTEQRAADRLHALATVARDLARVAGDTANFVRCASRLGIMAAEEVAVFLQLPKAAQSARVAQILAMTNKAVHVLNITSSALIAGSVLLDLLSLLADIKDNRDGNYSPAANKVWKLTEELTQEYYNIKEGLKVLKALGDESRLYLI